MRCCVHRHAHTVPQHFVSNYLPHTSRLTPIPCSCNALLSQCRVPFFHLIGDEAPPSGMCAVKTKIAYKKELYLRSIFFASLRSRAYRHLLTSQAAQFKIFVLCVKCSISACQSIARQQKNIYRAPLHHSDRNVETYHLAALPNEHKRYRIYSNRKTLQNPSAFSTKVVSMQGHLLTSSLTPTTCCNHNSSPVNSV